MASGISRHSTVHWLGECREISDATESWSTKRTPLCLQDLACCWSQRSPLCVDKVFCVTANTFNRRHRFQGQTKQSVLGIVSSHCLSGFSLCFTTPDWAELGQPVSHCRGKCVSNLRRRVSSEKALQICETVILFETCFRVCVYCISVNVSVVRIPCLVS